jgi:hypothetical protein
LGPSAWVNMVVGNLTRHFARPKVQKLPKMAGDFFFPAPFFAMISKESNVNAQPAKDLDELDLISSSTLASPASKTRRVSLDIVRKEVTNPQRKRTLSKSALENVVSGKKKKLQQKKAVSPCSCLAAPCFDFILYRMGRRSQLC